VLWWIDKCVFAFVIVFFVPDIDEEK